MQEQTSRRLGQLLVFTAVIGSCSNLMSQTTVRSPTQKAVLVELFTSEGCSSCPPADELLKQLNGHTTAAGQLIVGLSEHVSYWNGLGWKDPYSSDIYTDRQNAYSKRFRLEGVYTPQIVVNGREQLVGGDRRALESAFAVEATRHQIELHILNSHIENGNIIFTYSASGVSGKESVELVAVFTDDLDRSKVLRGENSGRDLAHSAVARSLAGLGRLQETDQRTATLPLPPTLDLSSGMHHLVLFGQETGMGAVMAIDSKQL